MQSQDSYEKPLPCFWTKKRSLFSPIGNRQVGIGAPRISAVMAEQEPKLPGVEQGTVDSGQSAGGTQPSGSQQQVRTEDHNRNQQPPKFGVLLGALDGALEFALAKCGIEAVAAGMRDTEVAHGIRIKLGRFIFSAIVVLAVVGTAGFLISNCRRNDDAQMERNTAQTQMNLATKFKEDRDDALRDNTRLERANERLERDRDRITDKLQMLEQRANIQVQTNIPSDKRLDAILDQLQLLGPLAFDFAFYLGGMELTNESIILIETNRTLAFSVKNISRITVENLTLNFIPMTDDKSFTYVGWDVRGHSEYREDIDKMRLVPIFTTKSDLSIAPGVKFRAQELKLSTNYTAPLLRVQLAAHADRSTERECYINLILKP